MSEPDLLFYDGTCGLCHWAVVFVLRHDAEGAAFRFAPLQGETYTQRLDSVQRASLPDSLAVVDPFGRIYLRSAGIIRILTRLGGRWRWLGNLLSLIPGPLRDFGYDGVAKIRKRLFKPPKESCPLVAEEMRSRFLV